MNAGRDVLDASYAIEEGGEVIRRALLEEAGLNGGDLLADAFVESCLYGRHLVPERGGVHLVPGALSSL